MDKKLKYEFAWYEMDQDLEIGKSGEYTLTTDEGSFFNGILNDKQYSVKFLTVNEILHPELGKIQKFSTEGLDYHITLENGTILEVNAEEEPGKIRDYPVQPKKWIFDVLVSFSD